MTQRTKPPLSLPHPNTYALPPARLLAGEYPFTPNPPEARRKLRTFLEAGIDYFVDLTEDGELDPYEEVLREESERMGIETTYVRHPVRDMSITNPDRMRRRCSTVSTTRSRRTGPSTSTAGAASGAPARS